MKQSTTTTEVTFDTMPKESGWIDEVANKTLAAETKEEAQAIWNAACRLELEHETPEEQAERLARKARQKCRTVKESTVAKTAKTKEERKAAYRQMLRDFEAAYASGNYTAELWELSTAIAYAVLNKVLDPQRKTAQERQTVSNNGRNPAMVAVKQGLTSDLHLLVNTRTANDAATYSRLNADGEMEWNLTADADALDAIGELIDECLTDGVDMIQEVAAAILEQAQAHAAADGWMEQPYTVKRISKRVLIKEDTAAWRDDVTTPVQEVYRAARRYIQNSRAAQTDPRNGYSYIEDFATTDEGGMEVIYHRMQKYADMGGNDCYGNYTADVQTAIDYYTILERLHLTEKQTHIVNLRMRGYGYKAIAAACGTTPGNILNTLYRIREKCECMGFSPLHYAAFADGEQD